MPVPEPTVATEVFEELHAPPASPSDEKVVVPLLHIACVPLIVAAFGAVVTVTVLVVVAFAHPPVPVMVYVIVAVPAATPDTIPVPEPTVATEVFEEVHAPPASPLEVKDVVLLVHIACVPLNVPAFGAVVTVTVLVAVAFTEHGEVAVTVYVIVAV